MRFFNLVFFSTVLPKFKVHINPPSYFKQDCEKIEVHANYVFGKPVVGRLVVNVSADIGDHYSRYGPVEQNDKIEELDVSFDVI